MDYRQLQYFLTIAEESSISKAARKLFISQQALSKTIEKLEDELGVPLFVRNNLGIELTKYGRELKTHAIPYVNSHEQIITHMRNFKEHDSNQFTLGYATGMMGQFPDNYLTSFINNHKDTKINIYSYPDDSYNRSLQNYDIDIIFCSMLPNNDSIDVLYHYRQKAFLLVSKNHPLATKDTVYSKDLANYPFIALNTDNEMQHNANSLFKDLHLDVRIYVSPSEYNCVYNLVSSGNYISLYATHYDDPFNLLVAREIEDFELFYDFYIVARKGTTITPLIEDLIQLTKKHLEKPISK